MKRISMVKFLMAQNENTNSNKIMETLKNLSNNNPEIIKKDFRTGDVFKTHASIDKIQSLGFTPKYPIEKGLELTYNWYYNLLNTEYNRSLPNEC